jgi:multidrug efflux system membrane fusion protein
MNFRNRVSLQRPGHSAGFAFVFFVLTLLSACGGADDATEEFLRPVRYTTVSGDSVSRERSFSGISKSSRESRLSFKVAGTVIKVPAQIGQRLERGELIAEIDPANYALQEQQAQATLVEAEANNRRAAANYERTKGLYANNNSSLNDLESARAEAESAQAVVRSAGKALEIARLNISYTRLTAAADCSIASLDVEVNENVSSGQQVAAVSCGEEFEVKLDVPESLIASVTELMSVTVRFGSIPDMVFSGQVSEVSIASSSGSAAFPVVITVMEKHPSLRSGLAAEVRFRFQTEEDQATGGAVLPVTAIIHDQNGTFVFIADVVGQSDEAIVQRREVTLGELSQSGIEVIDGLETGDRVITAGVSVIREGQRVLMPFSE